jgi:hypothetical protein
MAAVLTMMLLTWEGLSDEINDFISSVAKPYSLQTYTFWLVVKRDVTRLTSRKSKRTSTWFVPVPISTKDIKGIYIIECLRSLEDYLQQQNFPLRFLRWKFSGMSEFLSVPDSIQEQCQQLRNQQGWERFTSHVWAVMCNELNTWAESQDEDDVKLVEARNIGHLKRMPNGNFDCIDDHHKRPYPREAFYLPFGSWVPERFVCSSDADPESQMEADGDDQTHRDEALDGRIEFFSDSSRDSDIDEESETPAVEPRDEDVTGKDTRAIEGGLSRLPLPSRTAQ